VSFLELGITPIFRWYDLWVGVFVDTTKKRIYVFPVPMLGFVFSYGAARELEDAK
jgi:hypothetical protein